MTNQFFFIITLQDQATYFTSDQYTFTIKDSEQQTGTNGKALWYYEFNDVPNLDLKWVSWNQKNNGTKTWDYLLLKIRDNLYSGFINKSKTQKNIYYCKLESLPPKDNFEIIY